LATRKRVKVSHDIQAEIRDRKAGNIGGRPAGNVGDRAARIGDRELLPDSNDIASNRYWSNPVVNSTEADRFSKQESEGWNIPLTYAPTKTSWPGNTFDHRRTRAAGYDRLTGILSVQFYTDGSVYAYGTTERVPESIAYLFRLTNSPGRFINDYLENYGYIRVS